MSAAQQVGALSLVNLEAIPTCFDLLDQAQLIASTTGDDDEHALTMIAANLDSTLIAARDAIKDSARKAKDIVRARKRVDLVVELLRGSDDAELGFEVNGVELCQKHARSYVLNPVTALVVEFEMLSEMRVIGRDENWTCDCCEAQYVGGSVEAEYRRLAGRNG